MTTDMQTIIRGLIARAEAAHKIALLNPTPEQAEYQYATRQALQAMVDDLAQSIYLIDGKGVFEDETILMLRDQVYGLSDVIDGNPVGTLKRHTDDLLGRSSRTGSFANDNAQARTTTD